MIEELRLIKKTSKVSYKHLRKERNNQMAHISFI